MPTDATESLWPADLGTPAFLASAYRAGWKEALRWALTYAKGGPGCRHAYREYSERAKRLRRLEIETLLSCQK